jgi:hypothetical protein
MRRWWHTKCDWETPEAAVDLGVGGAVRAVVRYPMWRRVRRQRYIPRSRVWVPESASWVLSCGFVGEAIGPR